MPTAAPPQSDVSRPASGHRLGWIWPALVIAAAALWVAQGPLIRLAARFALPPLARSAGYHVEFDVLESRFFGPLLLGNVRLRDDRGSDLRASQVELALAAVPDFFRHPRRIVRRISVRELSGGFRLNAAPAARGAAPASAARRWFTPEWPLIIEVDASKVFLSHGAKHLMLKDTSLQLSEEQTGTVRVGELGIWINQWSKMLSDIRGVTAWRDGVAYLADIALAKDVVIDAFSATLHGPDAFTIKARAFNGNIYGEWSDGNRTTAALNAFDVSLDGLGRFLDLAEPMRGRLPLLKLTFSGDLAAPLESQSSLRAEVMDFSWDKRAFSSLRLGASLSGRNLKIDEFLLEQKANRVNARGSLLLPGADWRNSDVALNIDAVAKDARSLTDLFGQPWNKLSGGFTLEGDVTGRLGEPSGWIKARGWDLRLPGVPASSLQADATMKGGTLNIAALESHSGPNFLRAGGEISLREPLNYRGRLEARVREVSRYLEPLGRFAPDWAQQGGVICFWDGDGTGANHSGVVSLELFDFTGELNPVPVNGKLAATYSPGNVYVSRFFLDRGPLSLSASCYLSGKGLSMQDIQLFNLRQRLLRSEIFLPVSWPLLLDGKTWSQTMLPGGEIYATVRSDDLRLGPLANLFGQSVPFEGRVDWKLDASGPWENPSGESTLTIDGFRAAFDNFAIPSSRVESKVTLAKQRLDFAGQLDTDAADPVKLTASIPLLGRNEAGDFRILDRSKPASMQLDVPALALTKFAAERPLAGQLRGAVKMSGQLSAPQFEGAFEWDKVTFAPVTGLAPWTDFVGRFVFAGSEAKFEGAKGKMGEGDFTVEGRSELSDPLQITTTAKFSGKKLQLIDAEKFQFSADADLAVTSDPKQRTASGEISLVGSRAQVSLSATPLLMPSGTENKAIAVVMPFRVDGWLGNSETSIRIRSAEPVQLGDSATAAVDITLTGPLRETVPVGVLEFRGLNAEIPSGPLAFSRAKFSFIPESPRVPVLDLWGSAQVRGYQVAATVWGPLGQQQIKLESVPESLPPEIALLLGAGIDPEKSATETKLRIEPAGKTEELPPPQIGCTWQID